MSKRLVILISGSGTNLQAIIDAIAAKQLDAEIVLVVSHRKDVYGLVRAEQAGIPTLYFPLTPYKKVGKSRDAFDGDLGEQIKPYQPDLIVLAGWMLILGSSFLNQFPISGTFPGTEAIIRTYAAYKQGNVTEGGCMVHYVVPEVDAGPVISQVIVPIEPQDTLESFETHIHAAEHQLIVEATRKALMTS
jgi:formyltetrahydrofolate-dependent phosphoribosylglycinamide formyltransferase